MFSDPLPVIRVKQINKLSSVLSLKVIDCIAGYGGLMIVDEHVLSEFDIMDIYAV